MASEVGHTPGSRRTRPLATICLNTYSPQVLLQATGGDRQMLDMLVEATASPAAADRWRWKDVDAARCSAIIEAEASRPSDN